MVHSDGEAIGVGRGRIVREVVFVTVKFEEFSFVVKYLEKSCRLVGT